MSAKPVVNASATTSLYSLAQQIQQQPGEMLSFDLTLPIMARAEAELWVVFFMQLRGQKGTFLFGDPACVIPQGSMGVTPGTPVFNGAHTQRGTTVSLKGLPHSITGYGKAGDYLQFGSASTARLHKILIDINSDSSGNAANIDIFPQLRANYSDGDTITVTSCQGNFRLIDNNLSYDVDEAVTYQKSFSIRESL